MGGRYGCFFWNDQILHLAYSFLHRPPNPIEYLASYLLKNKSQFDSSLETTQPSGTS
jgi:hypothetical protein